MAGMVKVRVATMIGLRKTTNLRHHTESYWQIMMVVYHSRKGRIEGQIVSIIMSSWAGVVEWLFSLKESPLLQNRSCLPI